MLLETKFCVKQCTIKIHYEDLITEETADNFPQSAPQLQIGIKDERYFWNSGINYMGKSNYAGRKNTHKMCDCKVLVGNKTALHSNRMFLLK